ncbi:zinc ribbon domain-containing protein [Streptosporangium sp. NPDC002544]|uniref:Zn-ribbon domain-containing OB-fold protein n=1 Tax=Streptosporangium sp. NPDC002544 TaxID=3154538 RepID=UPI0033333811
MSTVSDRELLERLPGFLILHDNKEFYRGWLRRELVMNRCQDCGNWQHPPRPVCPECWSQDVRATPVSGKGVIHTLIWLRQGPPAPDVDYSTPHPVAMVELVEQPGLRFTSTVTGVTQDDIAIGSPVELAWIERHGEPFPVFRPAGS